MTTPATMRAAVLYDVDDIRIEERPVPALGPGDLLVRTGASGVCSGDLMPWYVRRKAPFVFGHEPAGTVAAVGAGISGFAVGDRIFAHHHAPCFACAACARGAYVHCATWRRTALDPGGMAEYFRVPAENLRDAHRLPPDRSFADASLLEPLACVVKSLQRAFPIDVRRPLLSGNDAATRAAADAASADAERGLAGRTLLVIGAGIMGLLHVAVASAAGATVFASDFDAGRLAVARSLGAETCAPDEVPSAIRERTGGSGADAVVCGPGTPAALTAALDATAPDGRTVMFTPIEPGERFAFDQSAAYFRDARLIASYSCGPDDMVDALALIAAGVVTAERLAVRRFAFPGVADAYRAMQAAAVVKAVVTFGEGDSQASTVSPET